jgi:peptide/nickel transport system substrate-binding protein
LISREGLTLLNRDGRVQARLAETWSESEDGLTWRFKLRSNAFFHDGTKVDSSAVKKSLERSQAGSEIDQYPGLADIVAIEAPDETELIIRLRARSTFLLDDLGVSILKGQPGEPAIGAGAYIPVSTSDNELVMRAFPQYYRGTPRIDRLVWKAYPTVRTAWAAMMRGEIDFLYEVGQDTREFIEGENSVAVFPFLRNYVYAVVLNAKRDAFSDLRVRKALNYAIDRDAIIDLGFKGSGSPASGPGWPQHWAYDSSVPGYSYDPARALALLDAAGIRAATAQDRKGPPARLHFNCIIPEGFPLWERIGLLVQRNLAEIGVDMQLEELPVDKFNQRIGAGDFDTVLVELIVGNGVSRPYFFWHSGSKLNVWGYKNPNVDEALDGIRRAPNAAAYRDAFRKFQLETLNDSPALFLVLGETTRAVSKRFQVVAPPNSDILPTIADWGPAGGGARIAN